MSLLAFRTYLAGNGVRMSWVAFRNGRQLAWLNKKKGLPTQSLGYKLTSFA